MAKLPTRIQQQIDAADVLLAQANAPAPEAPPAAEQPAVEPPQPEPTAQSVAPEPAAPTPAPQDPWEQRYRSLQGTFNNEVPRLQKLTKELETELRQAREALEKLNKPQAPQEQRPSADPKDVDAFGSDLVEMVQRVTQSVLGSMAARVDQTVTAFDARLTSVERALESTSKVVARSAEETFFDRLTAAVPDWESVNGSAPFLAWLGEVDPVYGQPRQAALDAAQANLNPERAVAVFNAFKATLPKPAAVKADPLGKQVTPRSSAAATPTVTEKPVITQAQIAAFYDDVAKRRYAGREAEAAVIEQTINLALAENRVR